jgi:hypothetical protein
MARFPLSAVVAAILIAVSCAPIEYSVVVVEASQALAEAEIAGANCTQEQLDRLSPVTQNLAPDPGTELATSEDVGVGVTTGEPMCDAPYEYYSAIEYIHKAREEVGYSDYEPAIEYAREARTMARKARDIALKRDRERGR